MKYFHTYKNHWKTNWENYFVFSIYKSHWFVCYKSGLGTLMLISVWNFYNNNNLGFGFDSRFVFDIQKLTYYIHINCVSFNFNYKNWGLSVDDETLNKNRTSWFADKTNNENYFIIILSIPSSFSFLQSHFVLIRIQLYYQIYKLWNVWLVLVLILRE